MDPLASTVALATLSVAVIALAAALLVLRRGHRARVRAAEEAGAAALAVVEIKNWKGLIFDRVLGP